MAVATVDVKDVIGEHLAKILASSTARRHADLIDATKASALGASLGVNAAMTAGEVHHIDFSGQDPVLTGKVTKI